MLLSRAVTGLRWVKSIPNGSASIPAMASAVVHRHHATASVSGRDCHGYRRPLCTTSFNSNTGSSPGNDKSGSVGGGGGGNDGFDANAMFSNENVRNLSPTEVARLNITYGLIQDHIDAIRRGYTQVDPTSNPLIDPRSFQLKRLPRVPDDVLKHFRRELPASVASDTRPVVTRDIWDNNNNNMSPSISSATGRSPRHGGPVPGHGLELMSESLESMQDWDRIDERTMTTHSLSRRLRTSTTSMTAALTTDNKTDRKQPHHHQRQQGSFVTTAARMKKRKPIVLRDSSGRVEVDFRCVATLNMFLTEGGKILPRRKTGLSARSQKKVSKAIKRARCMALINPVPKGPTMAELVAMHDEDEFGTGEELMEMIRQRDEAAAGSSSSGKKKKK